ASDDPAHGGERGTYPRQRRFPDEACGSARYGRHRIDLRERRKPRRRPRRAAEKGRAMMLTVLLACCATLIAVSILAIAIGRSATATPIVYGLSLTASVVSCSAGVVHLLGATAAERLTLPLGLPWLGAHFHLDAL